jgi:hypothetical protein
MACCKAGQSKDPIRSSIVVDLLIVVAIVKTSSVVILSRRRPLTHIPDRDQCLGALASRRQTGARTMPAVPEQPSLMTAHD